MAKVSSSQNPWHQHITSPPKVWAVNVRASRNATTVRTIANTNGLGKNLSEKPAATFPSPANTPSFLLSISHSHHVFLVLSITENFVATLLTHCPYFPVTKSTTIFKGKFLHVVSPISKFSPKAYHLLKIF
jgi:hypothetical protein